MYLNKQTMTTSSPTMRSVPVAEMNAEDDVVGRKRSTHAKRGLLALVDQGFVSLNTFVTMVLVTQLCARSDLNLYALAWSVFAFFRVGQERALGCAVRRLCTPAGSRCGEVSREQHLPPVRFRMCDRFGTVDLGIWVSGPRNAS